MVAELIEERKLNSDIGSRVVHFRLVGQFLGFSGSSGPLHVTCVVEVVSEVGHFGHAGTCSWARRMCGRPGLGSVKLHP